MRCEAIELTEMGQGNDDRLFLPVRLFYAMRLEFVKSIVLTAFVHLLCRFSSKWFCSVKATLSVVKKFVRQAFFFDSLTYADNFLRLKFCFKKLKYAQCTNVFAMCK